MFMISKFMYEVVYQPRNFLTIDPRSEENHISNFYYFRLGAQNVGGKPEISNAPLRIPKNGFVTVWSMESFTLSERVLGLFGNLSELVRKGLQLVHSPSIDPGFSGGLELGIRNNTGENLELAPGERIGKILFFDVSDTIIDAEDFVNNVLKQKQLAERRKAADQLNKLYGEWMKGQPPSRD